PIFLTVARVAVEKNLEAFLSLPLPGSKVVVGEGPQRAALMAAYPDAVFLGLKQGIELAEIYASADVFVFPSLTDTYGIVLLEAAASGLPVAAFPVQGPVDVFGDSGAAALDNDLHKAAMTALRIPRETAVSFAKTRSWHDSARQFYGHMARLSGHPLTGSVESAPAMPAEAPVEPVRPASAAA
ncbi:MAG: glycosyltransferase, partial [Bosea sp. (in: a-proteobacteria)]